MDADLFPIAFAFVEIVVMCAELLARRITLALHRLTLFGAMPSSAAIDSSIG